MVVGTVIESDVRFRVDGPTSPFDDRRHELDRTGSGDGPAPTAHGGAGFRVDIEGLRAVAVVLVVLFHAGVTAVAGGFIGVDVFFVLSGFLITGVLLREVDRSGGISLARFYARRARRLLPLAAVVLVTTAIASWLILTLFDFPSVGRDTIAAALYFSNWRFALQHTSYMNAEGIQSPLLHFWSLAVEEQFYLFWPVIVLVTASRRGLIGRVAPRLSPRARFAVPLVVIGASSFVASVVTSTAGGPMAYYGLHTRAWELAAGGLLAIAAPSIPRFGRRMVAMMGWTGLALIGIAALTFSDRTVFPGYAAALPVFATILVLIAGSNGATRGSVAKVLGFRPVRYVGRVSYAWYLWHWPCLVLTRVAITGGTSIWVNAWVIFAVVVGSFGLAAASHALIENPVRYARWLTTRPARALLAGVLFSGVATVSGVQLASAGGPLSIKQIVPQSKMQEGNPCNRNHDQTDLTTCVLGDPTGTKTLAVFGDSHAMMWSAALDRLGRERHWRVLPFTKEGCVFADVPMVHPQYHGAYAQCTVWRSKALAKLRGLHIDTLLVVRSSRTLERITGTDGSTRQTQAAYAAGFRRSLDEIGTAASHVIVLADTPFLPFNPKICAAEHLEQRDSCSFSRSGAVHHDSALLDAEQSAGAGAISFTDMTAVVCPAAECPARMANGQLMYWDTNHLTDVYVGTVWQAFGNALDTASNTPPG
jgi:peptidoglycan/LPS O-acetylase OafA/YrhL